MCRPIIRLLVDCISPTGPRSHRMLLCPQAGITAGVYTRRLTPVIQSPSPIASSAQCPEANRLKTFRHSHDTERDAAAPPVSGIWHIQCNDLLRLTPAYKRKDPRTPAATFLRFAVYFSRARPTPPAPFGCPVLRAALV
uniref:Uncharacterized protein n=1 Tax=Mycena chlorophos TaxID=658473 RepID=A0ABQ0LX62_MYCCL|nr:predicted protein [Mycena chlorophos]